MSQVFTQRQLDAGGLVATKTKCDPKLTEAIVARTYGSKALGDRVVVRLSSDRLVPAEDLAMEYLGLEGQDVTPPLARQNRTALDFAHWALINQPKQARYALDLVKRMKSAARRASSKPGHAWDMYAEMADELNKSVRHFLPPFWEQAARSFKDLGNVTYAGRALNKALEAERVHALDVDREHRRDAVLEFSLSGCLSGKALTDYSKDLAKQFEPAEAYETYKDLVIRRTMGGMPPAANAASDLIRMAKAAKLDVDQEVESVLEAIISSPAMSRAPMQFWKSVKKHVARIEAFGIWLLAHTDPQRRYTDDSLVWQWLDLLEEWNILPLLSKPADEMPEGIEIPGGRAGWFSRLASVEASPNKRVFELLEQMAEVLRDEGQPISLPPTNSSHSFVDIDVLEACLQLGLEVETPHRHVNLDFDGWLRKTIDHPRRNSQLEFVTKDPRFVSRLRAKLPELIAFRGDNHFERSWERNVALRRSFEEAAADHPQVREEWWQYLDTQIQSLESGGLVDFEKALETLKACAGVKTAAEFPELLSRIKAVDPLACLHRTLSAGVFDEYGWEMLDRVDDEYSVPPLTGRPSDPLHWIFPRFAFLQDNRVHVVDPESHLPPREVDLPKEHELQVLLPVGDDLLVAYRDNTRSWKVFIHWLSEPKKEHEQQEIYYSWNVDAIVRLNDSSWFYGARAIQPGDATLPDATREWFCDESRFWRVKESSRYDWLYHDEDESELGSPVSEIDPEIGNELRDSVPPFFEADLPAGARVNWRRSHLLPLPQQAGASPLGSRDGKIGWRVVRRRDEAMESVGIDGRRVTFEADAQPASGFLAAIGLMDKPASDSSWIITNDGRLMDSDTHIAFARIAYNRTKYFAGQPAQLPTLFWHLMRVRSPESSKKLRSTTIEQADLLLKAGLVEHEAKKEKEDPKNPGPNRNAAESAVAEWLAKAPPRLITGVARIARVAAEEQISLNNLLKRFGPEEDERTGESPAVDATVEADRAGAGMIQLDLPLLPGVSIYRYPSQQDNAAHLMMVARFFAGHACEEIPACDLFWFGLLRDPAAVIWRSFWKTATDVELGESVASRVKTPWLDALRCLAESNLLDLPGGYKIYHANASSDAIPKKGSIESGLETAHPIAFQEGKNRYVAYRFPYFPNDQVFVLAYAENGKLKPPKKLTVENTFDVNPGWQSRNLRWFLDSVKQVDKLPLPAAEDLDAAAQEFNVHPIAVALTYMGDLRTVRFGQEKLTKELRDHYGWKVREIQLAISQLDGLDRPESVGCVYFRKNSSGALGEKRDVSFNRMIKAWKENRKVVLAIPGELANDFERATGGYHRMPMMLFAELLSDPKLSDVLVRRKAGFAKPKHGGYYHQLEVQYSPSPKSFFEPESLFPHLIKVTALVNYKLPVGDPLRKQIPVLIDELRSFIDAPETQLPFGNSMTQDDDIPNTDVEATVATFATQVRPLEQGEDGLYRGDNGFVSLALVPPHVCMLFRTSKLKDDSALARLRSVASLTTDYGGPGADNLPCADFVLRMRSEEISELAEDNRQPSAPEGSWEQDPRVSVPAIVQQAVKEMTVSEDAAALYLQTLALPDPTALNVRKWNGWSTKQYKEAAAELVAGEYLVSAKRTRAGRETFLPGGWEDLKLPNLPIESWKLPMFGYDSTERLRGGGAEMIVCERSIRRQFETAWQRVQDGDPPRYEEATTKRKRK